MQTKRFIKASITAFIFVFAIAGAVQATTTIGSNISTDGTLSVATTTTLTGATTMSAALTLTSTTNPQVTIKYDASNYFSTYVGSAGTITFDSVGSAVHSVFLFSDTVTIATTTNESLLTVDGNTSSTTLAVYQRGSGDILNVFDSATEVFTILDGGGTGVASSTPWGDFSVEMDTTNPAFVVSNDGSTTPALFVSGVNGNGRIGIGTSSPEALFSVDAGSTETTTIDFGRACFKFWVNGQTLYFYPTAIAGSNFGWATSTTSCY